MPYIVLDLEATCWREQRPNQHNEIIEIGAVRLDDQGQVVSEFAQFVKPLKHPLLSDFCTELTSITQAQVEAAPYFSDVLPEFFAWAGIGTERYLLCSWGFYDRKQLAQDCALHGLDAAWTQPHISLKHQYAQIRRLKRPIGMARALAMEGLHLDGTHHRGIDDARNITKIFQRYLEEWQEA